MKKTNRNYQKGCRMERELVNMWRKIGYVAFRSAGSHSPIDVVAVDPKTMNVILVQCKNARMTEKQIAKLGKEIGLTTKWDKTSVRVFVAHKVKGESETKLSLV